MEKFFCGKIVKTSVFSQLVPCSLVVKRRAFFLQFELFGSLFLVWVCGATLICSTPLFFSPPMQPLLCTCVLRLNCCLMWWGQNLLRWRFEVSFFHGKNFATRLNVQAVQNSQIFAPLAVAFVCWWPESIPAVAFDVPSRRNAGFCTSRMGRFRFFRFFGPMENSQIWYSVWTWKFVHQLASCTTIFVCDLRKEQVFWFSAMTMRVLSLCSLALFNHSVAWDCSADNFWHFVHEP